MSAGSGRGKSVRPGARSVGASTCAVTVGGPDHPAAWGVGPGGERPHNLPVFLTSNYEYADADGADRAARGEAFLYARVGNPTVAAFERALAALESPGPSEVGPAGRPLLRYSGEKSSPRQAASAVESVAFASGMAALSATVFTLAGRNGEESGGARGELLVSEGLYGGTTELMREWGPRLGLSVRFVPAWDTEAVREAIGEGTRAIIVETLSNPLLRVVDLPALAALARAHGAALIVDSTFTPLLLRPLAHGATAVVHSVSKYIAGHGDLVGGVVIASPAVAARIRHTRTTLGGIMDPFSAWLALRGLRTLPLRMERQCANAAQAAAFLAGHARVRSVSYPGLPSHPDAVRARTLLAADGAIVSFDLGSRAKARAVYDRVRLIRRAASLGDVASLLTHPASFSHRALDESALFALGIGPGLLRLSAGIEDGADLVAELAEVLDD